MPSVGSEADQPPPHRPGEERLDSGQVPVEGRRGRLPPAADEVRLDLLGGDLVERRAPADRVDQVREGVAVDTPGARGEVTFGEETAGSGIHRDALGAERHHRPGPLGHR